MEAEGQAEAQAEGPLTTPSATAKPWQSKLKRIAIQTGVALAAIGAAYGVGRFQTSQRIDLAEKRAEEASALAKATQEELARERGLTQQLEARRELSLALSSLEKRNFGIAEEALVRAAQRLEGSSGDLDAVRKAIEGTRLVASEDLDAQRAKLLDLVRRFDAALPPRKG